MLLGLRKEEVDDWHSSLHGYEKAKRTKRPFGRKQPEVEQSFRSNLENRSLKFDPILQNYKDEKELSKTIEHEEIKKMNGQMKFMKNNYRYNVDYDILNFHPAIALSKEERSHSLSIHEPRKKQYKDPTYNDFDIINGYNQEEQYLAKRDLKNVKNYKRKYHHHRNQRAYNIINGGHSEQPRNSRIDEYSLNSSSLRKSQATSDFDPVFCRYNSPEKEEQFQSQMMERRYSHGRNYQQRLPPSYKYKESVELNPEVPIPPVVQELDEKEKQNIKKFEKKHLIEEEYRMRNQFDAQKKEELAKNRIHNGRMLQSKARQFDIFNAHPYEQNRTERLYNKKIDDSGYDIRPHVTTIKQSGFQTLSI